MATKLKNNTVKSVTMLFYWRAFYFQPRRGPVKTRTYHMNAFKIQLCGV